MKKKLLYSCSVFCGVGVVILLSSVRKTPPGEGVNCKDLSERDGVVSLFFPPPPNEFRKSGYEFYIPSPDMRFGNVPGQATIFPTDFYCTVKVTSPNCSAFQWYGSYENSGNNLNIKLPPIGFDAVIEVNYIERGEDYTTPDFNKSVIRLDIDVYYNFSRVIYKAKKTYPGGGSGTLFVELELNHNQGYDLDAGGRIKTYMWTGGKGDVSDLSGLNTYINAKNMNFTGN